MRLFQHPSVLLFTSAVVITPCVFAMQEPSGEASRVVPAREESLQTSGLKPLDARAYVSTGMWDFGSNLAVAALLEAESNPDNGKLVEKCRSTCKIVAIELPPFQAENGDPIAGEDRITAKARALNYLLRSGGPRISRAINEKLGLGPQRSFDIGIKATIALELYNLDGMRDAAASAITKAGGESGLPTALWEPIVRELGQAGTQDGMKKALLEACALAESYLALRPAVAEAEIDRTPRKVHVPSAGFSYDPPTGWTSRPGPGLSHPTSMGPLLQDFRCNIVSVDARSELSLGVYMMSEFERVRAIESDLILISITPFETSDGLAGYRVISKFAYVEAAVRQVQFFFESGDRKIVVTCSAPAQGGEKLDELLAASMKTFRLHPVEPGK
ncbi:MAG: hypothetical protein IPN34_23060 [Planctomycetes bacterium]|nr:hypothetical protein [Planctomycetota bacterium]